MLINSSCQGCTHCSVCKYKEKYEELFKKLKEDKNYITNDLDLTLTCNKFNGYSLTGTGTLYPGYKITPNTVGPLPGMADVSTCHQDPNTTYELKGSSYCDLDSTIIGTKVMNDTSLLDGKTHIITRANGTIDVITPTGEKENK